MSVPPCAESSSLSPSASISSISSNPSPSKSAYLFLSSGGGAELRVRRTTNNDIVTRLYCSGYETAAETGDANGMYILTRDNAANYTVYRNGSSLYTAADASSAVTAGVLTTGTTGTQLSCFGVGSSLTSGNVTTLTNAFEAWMDSNGKGVIA